LKLFSLPEPLLFDPGSNMANTRIRRELMECQKGTIVASYNGHTAIVERMIGKGGGKGKAKGNPALKGRGKGKGKGKENQPSHVDDSSKEKNRGIPSKKAKAKVVDMLFRRLAHKKEDSGPKKQAAVMDCVQRNSDLNRLLDDGHPEAMASAALILAEAESEMVAADVGGDIDVNKANTKGATPLYIASYNGHTEFVERLLARGGIDVNKATTTDGFTPLNAASFHGHTAIIELLLARRDIDVNKAKRETSVVHRKSKWAHGNR